MRDPKLMKLNAFTAPTLCRQLRGGDGKRFEELDFFYVWGVSIL